MSPRYIEMTPRLEELAQRAERQGIDVNDPGLMESFAEAMERYIWEQNILRISARVKAGEEETYTLDEMKAMIDDMDD
ncbi:MAG: hypothetical protein Q4P78_05855 [Rothia sp. (in: high G+C Gram-positive bacteria)]|uniref:hypothetical protein n=1 Tax=Rothia sp. (in: high G+C Gram-positive bacteria) TaxID=1885016 RepID=UPI0026DF6965|nr:hypothetical protein [Rothia sp. (in: high G+C Gram-positive bacteria)]MDO5750713.1 hypothetical protein [Rothia sp. (in: high G+C Gram-positive bacteria)]